MLHIYLAIGGLGAIGHGLMMLVDPDGTQDRARGPSSLHFWGVASMTFGILGVGLSWMRLDPEMGLSAAIPASLAFAWWRSSAPSSTPSDLP